MTTRRQFIAASSASLGALAVIPASGRSAHVATASEHDLVIRSGTVFTGDGGPGQEADVAITNGRIVAVGPRIAGRGAEEIDARGLAVSPGFVDIHSHAEGNLSADPRLESAIRQGITTVVVGADGSSSFTGESGKSFAEWAARVDALKPSINFASMIGLGTVREAVVGEGDRRATADELARMVAMVERALADGACGVSTGLEYAPGAFATPDELIALSRPAGSRGLPYASHLRNEDDRLLESIDEALAVGRGAQCPVQVSHLKQQGARNWPKYDASIARLAAARAEGVDAWFDVYPYEAYSTGMSNLFPISALDGGTAAFLARLADPAQQPTLRAYVQGKIDLLGGWDQIQIASARAPEDRTAEGKRLGSYAQSIGMDPYLLCVAMLTRNNGSVATLGFGMSEANIDKLLAHPYGMVCSDGGAFAIDGPTRRGSPHPRGAGTFPRVLGRYVRERKALALDAAIPKLSAIPARRLRLTGRGRLAPAFVGDVVVFDPSTIADAATFANPFQYPVGIHAVVVNGQTALLRGERIGAGQGQVVRPA